MKKRLALAAALAFSVIPFTSFADHLEPDDGYDIEPNADLSGAELGHADLSNANLSGSDLSGANLSDTDLCGANLSGADLSGAELNRVKLNGGCGNRNTNFSGADLSNANLNRANLGNDYLDYANLSGADLNSVNLSGAILQNADLSNANLQNVNLRGANLSGADMTDADLNYVRLQDADLRRANLSGADMTDLYGGCPKFLPEGWVCGGDPVISLTYDESLLPPKPEFFTFNPILGNKKVKVFNNSLPYQTECFGEGFLKISLSDNGKFLVQLDEKNKYDGFDFKKAGKKFKKTYKKCSLPTTQPGSPWPTTQPVNPNPNQVPSINF